MTTAPEAGPALDALVAQEVMGWEFCDCGIYQEGPHRHDPDDWIALEITPAFSTTYEGMGLVLERMRAFGWTVQMFNYQSGGANVAFVNQAMAYDDERALVSRDARTLPHAVALAALEAVRAAARGVVQNKKSTRWNGGSPITETRQSRSVKYLLPGVFMPEETNRPYEGVWPPDEAGIAWALENAPANAFCFTFHTVTVVEVDGERLVGKGSTLPGRYYIGGEVVYPATLPDDEHHRILKVNALDNGWAQLIRCRTGNWQPFEPEDRALPDPALSRAQPE